MKKKFNSGWMEEKRDSLLIFSFSSGSISYHHTTFSRLDLCTNPVREYQKEKRKKKIKFVQLLLPFWFVQLLLIWRMEKLTNRQVGLPYLSFNSSREKEKVKTNSKWIPGTFRGIGAKGSNVI